MTLYLPPDQNQYRAINWRLVPNSGLYISPLNRRMQGVSRSGDYWACDIELTTLTDAEHRWWRATLAKIASRFEPILLSDYMNARPQNYPTGTGWGSPLVNGASQTGRSLIVDAWTAGAALKAGDYVAFQNPAWKELHMLEEDVTANGSGQATLTLTPPIRISPTDNQPVLLDGLHANSTARAGAEMLLVPGAVGWSSDPAYREINPFSAIEFLR